MSKPKTSIKSSGKPKPKSNSSSSVLPGTGTSNGNANAKRKRTDFDSLNVGDRLSEIQYYEIVSTDVKTMRVKNERGFEFTVSKEIVEEGMFNASQFSETKKVSRTVIVDILENTGGAVFTVNFDKKPTDSSVLDVLKSFTIADFGDSNRLAHISEKIARGENRTLTGYMVNSEPKMGRSKVVDLTKPAPANTRLVDHRTLNWLIFKGVKYTC